MHPDRLQVINDRPLRADGQYVLYWMIAFRRTTWNHALQHAVQHAKQLGKPLVIFEPLRIRYRWASDRLHQFVIQGMRDNADALAKKPVTYYPYVEPKAGAATPLLAELAKRAAVVVTDEYPCFFLPQMISAVSGSLDARLELVDSNGVIPLRLPDRTFTVAHSYRRWMQKHILDALCDLPKPDPLARIKLPVLEKLPPAITRRWPAADFTELLDRGGVQKLPIDHRVPSCPQTPGGQFEAAGRLERFLHRGLAVYNQDRNHPDEHATTALSPYLHFGHISSHEIVARVLEQEQWTPDKAAKPNGKNHGFWNVSESAEAFLDQVLTWREIGFNMSFRRPHDYDKFESLPAWALATLRQHAHDKRPALYDLTAFDQARTHDELWNAAQRELVLTGGMHNYLRMLWGKLILHWSPTPEDALATMIELNNRYALDGRDPNSYSGIFWVLGRYDRAWGPKRPVFGSVRYMTSDSTRKKLRLKQYLRRFNSLEPSPPG